LRPDERGFVRVRITPLLLGIASVAVLAATGGATRPFVRARLVGFRPDSPVAGRAADAPRVVHVTARRFEYDPSEIHVAVGESVVLEIESLDRTHGFSIPDLHVRADVAPGTTTRLTLPAAVPGIHVFACDVFCGSHHEEMAGALIVE
jgi:cytochrome c oxidase subunit II